MTLSAWTLSLRVQANYEQQATKKRGMGEGEDHAKQPTSEMKQKLENQLKGAHALHRHLQLPQRRFL